MTGDPYYNDLPRKLDCYQSKNKSRILNRRFYRKIKRILRKRRFLGFEKKMLNLHKIALIYTVATPPVSVTSPVSTTPPDTQTLVALFNYCVHQSVSIFRLVGLWLYKWMKAGGSLLVWFLKNNAKSILWPFVWGCMAFIVFKYLADDFAEKMKKTGKSIWIKLGQIFLFLLWLFLVGLFFGYKSIPDFLKQLLFLLASLLTSTKTFLEKVVNADSSISGLSQPNPKIKTPNEGWTPALLSILAISLIAKFFLMKVKYNLVGGKENPLAEFVIYIIENAKGFEPIPSDL